MKSANNKSLRFKTILNSTFIIGAILFLVLLFVFKGSMNTLISKKMKEQAGIDVQKSLAVYIDSAFNYHENGENFRVTFLEFGATGCNACKRMEKVMEEVRISYPGEIKVKFINVMMPASQDLMKYYGVVVIPTQVLLNAAGQEVFRHTGYFSFDELDNEFHKINL